MSTRAIKNIISSKLDSLITRSKQKIKEETKATIRCIPLNNKAEEGKCIYSDKPSSQKVIFAKAY